MGNPAMGPIERWAAILKSADEAAVASASFEDAADSDDQDDWMLAYDEAASHLVDLLTAPEAAGLRREVSDYLAVTYGRRQ